MFLRLNMLIAHKEPQFYFFSMSEACVVSCGGPKKFPRTSSIVRLCFLLVL